MQIGWIDFSKSDRDKVLDIIASLKESGTIDELGIGVVRDAFADVFFPGTSTVMTRANRYKCLAIRENVAKKYGTGPFAANDIWREMFKLAEKEKKPGQSDLIPYWCFGENQEVKIERLVPMYPLSVDQGRYSRLQKILQLYRLTLGQANQEELVEYFNSEFKDFSKLKELFIDLCPFKHENRQ